MENEQSSIVLKLLKEIELLKEENTSLRRLLSPSSCPRSMPSSSKNLSIFDDNYSPNGSSYLPNSRRAFIINQHNYSPMGSYPFVPIVTKMPTLPLKKKRGLLAGIAMDLTLPYSDAPFAFRDAAYDNYTVEPNHRLSNQR